MRSTDEAYADCPWRERGSYIGDSLVTFQLQQLVTADLSIARRTFANFGRAQRPGGQLPACVPFLAGSRPPRLHAALGAGHTGLLGLHRRCEFIRAQLPVIRRILTGSSWKSDADGLWDTTGAKVFIDWGVLVEDRHGSANTAVNILRIAALQAASVLSRAIGE
jgi:alpha-L-rhamnosidase